MDGVALGREAENLMGCDGMCSTHMLVTKKAIGSLRTKEEVGSHVGNMKKGCTTTFIFIK